LHSALRNKNIDVALLLIERGAYTNLENCNGATARSMINDLKNDALNAALAISDVKLDAIGEPKDTLIVVGIEQVKEHHDVMKGIETQVDNIKYKGESYNLNVIADSVLRASIPVALFCIVISNPMHHLCLSGSSLAGSLLCIGTNAGDARAISGYSASTTLYYFAESLSDEYVMACKLVSATLAITTTYYAVSYNISDSSIKLD
jgi:ankyrin repeat protein